MSEKPEIVVAVTASPSPLFIDGDHIGFDFWGSHTLRDGKTKNIVTHLATGEVPGTLPALIVLAQNLLDQVPPEYRDNTTFWLREDCGDIEAQASWCRPQTPDDIAKEKARYEAMIAEEKTKKESDERAELARLKAKYEASR